MIKLNSQQTSKYRQWILTFRLKYVFVVGKIIRTARQAILKLSAIINMGIFNNIINAAIESLIKLKFINNIS